MEEIKKTIKDKIKTLLSVISDKNTADNIGVAAEAVEHLSRAYSYLNQIKESEV